VVINKIGAELGYVPEHIKTLELCIIAVKKDAFALAYTPDHFKTFNICSIAFNKDKQVIQYIPEKFITIKFPHESIVNTTDDCAICMTNEGDWCKLDCGHSMHLKCIKKIVENHQDQKCPFCRCNIKCEYGLHE
jgi:hypothetical protein